MKELFLILIGTVLIVGSIVFFWDKPINLPMVVRVGNASVNVEIASTLAERSQGLSDRESLEPGSGMLFIFENPGLYGFWMKDMHFAIDIIWIDAGKRVVSINKSVQPDSYPTTFHPTGPAKYVLEVPAGFSDTWSIEIGDEVHFETQIDQNQGLSPYRL